MAKMHRSLFVVIMMLILVGCSKLSSPQQGPDLGLTRDSIVSAFSEGFNFQPMQKENEPPQYIGNTYDNSATLWLFGPPENLSRIAYMCMLESAKNPAFAAKKLMYAKRVIKAAFPDWQEVDVWFDSNFREAKMIGPVKTVRGMKQIYLEFMHPDNVLIEINPVGVTPLAEQNKK